MARSSKNDPTESGVLVYPRLPVPDNRKSEPAMKRPRKVPPGLAATIAAGGLAVGTILGFVIRPSVMPDPRLGKFELAFAEATKTMTAERARADGLEAELKQVSTVKAALEQELAGAKDDKEKRTAEALEALKRSEAADAAAQKKLTDALEKGTGSVSAEGEEIHLQLVDKVLFKVGDDQLTDRGKAVLAKVGVALKELPDKQIWVQGHTDDTPIVVPPAPKKGKGAPPAGPRFASNWELSAARALTVVHYLQDVAKIDPAKLAALAFGPYRPVSRSNKAANRRIEIVLYPHRAVIDRK